MRTALLGKALIAAMVLTGLSFILHHVQVIDGDGAFMRLAFMFFTGATFYVLRAKIIISPKLFWPLVTLMLISLVNKEAFHYVYTFTLAYSLFYLAYIPAGMMRHYNHLGDYSYGIYIYSFPIQQSLAALFPGISIPAMVVGSTFATFAVAILSWHFLEKNALRLKPRRLAVSIP